MSSARNITAKTINLTIDGKACTGVFGQTILEIARENDIYIPTMCYLTKVLPIASCRMCVVDVEGVDGMILSCQEKATDGAVIHTQNAELYKERQNIMKLYNVNHPLECGVCDKSGECDLQNKTMEFGVSGQNFTTKEPSRPVQNWGHISYDPALCIMCEKCVRVSTEITGDEALKVKFGGYSSTILNVKQDQNLSSLGEAAAVCPVGALVSSDFKYSANAWELNQIPASCTHCSSACQLNYEVKGDKVYRVTNNAEHASLCGAGRFGFNFANENVIKNKEAFTSALKAFNDAGTINFSSNISNEEALILQKLKELKGYKLVSKEAKDYQSFLKAYSEVTGSTLYNGNLKALSQSRAVIVMGSRINDDNPMVKYHINMASKWHRARVAYMHSLEDSSMQNIVTQFIKYEAGSEEGVAALLADTLLKDIELPKGIQTALDNLDIGNLSAETNIGEEELEALAKSLLKKSGFSLVVGADVYAHPRAANIAKLLGLLEHFAGFNVVLVPPTTNALGVSLICELDDELEGSTIGYNVQGDFTLSAFGEGDLDMPAMNQQEGTLTSIDKRVVPTNVAISYGGYVLNDIANALGLNAEYTINYTEQLPLDKGFEATKFDALPNYFDAIGNENRGYLLRAQKASANRKIEEVEELSGLDGVVVYNCNHMDQFTPFTAQCETLKRDAYLLGSGQFATAAKVTDGDTVCYTIDGVKFERVFKIDTSLKGTIALNPTFDMGLSSALLSSYRFSQVDLERVGS
ncbi:(2Fe-2S)-binding protein [bacterium]|nr:(2Fe-2S)-binding protein [bacterium]MBU1959195.1 (2Fe-2S)-binding protein [bacterium]